MKICKRGDLLKNFSPIGLAAVVLAASLFTSGCSTIRKSPNFKDRSAEIVTIGLADPDLEIEKHVFKGTNEMLFDEAKASAKILKDTLAEEFKKRGYAIRELETWIKPENTVLLDDLSRLKDRHQSMIQDIQKQYVLKMKWKNFKMSLGSDVNPVADAAEADILIFAWGTGYVKSGGEHAGDFAKSLVIGAASLGHVVYVEPPYEGQVFLSVVDGDNGDILWHNFSNPGVPRKLTDEKNMKAIAKEIIARYPKAKKRPALESEKKLADDVTVSEEEITNNE